MPRCLNCNKTFVSGRKDKLHCSHRCRKAYSRLHSRVENVTDNADKTILSLCDYSGTWSQPYTDAGYHVERIDLAHGQDVRLLKKPAGSVRGILAAPPCTCFAIAGARWKRTDAEMLEALSVVDACLRLVMACAPDWWALENPVGTLKNYLGPPAFYFEPCDYGDAYTKKTCLWGRFKSPKPTNRVEPITVLPGHNRIDVYWKDQGAKLGKERQQLRSITPKGFAEAFFTANP